MRKFFSDIFKTSFLIYGVYCFVDKWAASKARKMKEEEDLDERL